MNMQQFLQASLNGGRTIPRWVRRLSLAIVLVPVLFIYVASHGAPALTNTNASAATRLEPGTQSVMDYLRVHNSIPDHALSADPAAQSVTDYLWAHGSIPAQGRPLDPAEQSVLDYLHAHGQ
jgi:hypothetical protein